MFKHIKESNMFKTAVVFRDRADKFISRVLLPIGIFLAFSPNILEPSGLWLSLIHISEPTRPY